MKPKDIKRLMELAGKANRTAEETTEFNALQAKANALPESDEVEMTSAELSATVTAAAKAALVDAKVTGVTEAQMKTVVDAAVKSIEVKGLDAKSVGDVVAEQLKAVKPGCTVEDVKSIVTEALKNVRTSSKMQHSEDETGDRAEIDFPISHRKGNLSVAEKQLLNVMTKKSENDGIPESILQTAEKRGMAAERKLISRMSTKAITATGSGTGLEFMNVTLSSVLLMRLYLESKLAAAMLSREIQMPSNPFNLPLGTTRPVFRSGVAENAAPTASDPGTAQLSLNAKKLMGMVQYSDEADEDSIIAILPMVTDQLGQAAAEALEDAILNGDTAGTQDTGGAAGDALRLWDGVRKLTLAQASLKVSLATGGISAANIAALRKALGKWGMNPNDLLLVFGTSGYNDVVLLPETLTAEKAGNQATARILTGTAPNLFGIDIIPSVKAREDLNASGVYDGTTTTKGGVYLLHKPSWITGVRRGFTMETWRDARAQTNYVIASFRRDFKPLEALSNTKAAAFGYNYTS